MNKRLFLVGCAILLMMLSTETAFAQRIWSNVNLNRTSAYVGQPIQVTIEVYTSTWFTSGIDPGNIKVEGAFTIYFRPVSTSIKVDGKTYAGVRLIYNVFPHRSGNIIFPSLNLSVESPPEGDYKGVERVLTTDQKPITVKPIPSDFTGDQWLVATGLSVNDRYPQGTTEAKVGDVWSRSITRTAYGTVSELIPPLVWDSIPGISQYPARSQVESHKTKTSIYATRTETMRYLFVEEGDIIIPEKTIYWFHAGREKLYKKTLPAIALKVVPNPDLAMVKSVRDSLNAQTTASTLETAGEESQPTILGMTVKQFLTTVILGLAILWLLFVGIRELVRYLKKRRTEYLYSESYYFKQFQKAIHGSDFKTTVNHLYHWLDQLGIREPTAQQFSDQLAISELKSEVDKLNQDLTDHKATIRLNADVWKRARKAFLEQRDTPEEKSNWINP